MLQCVAVCCRVLQCVAVCCSVQDTVKQIKHINTYVFDSFVINFLAGMFPVIFNYLGLDQIVCSIIDFCVYKPAEFLIASSGLHTPFLCYTLHLLCIHPSSAMFVCVCAIVCVCVCVCVCEREILYNIDIKIS